MRRTSHSNNGPSISLEFDRTDTVLPCPFCGGSDIELCNTHTASYWLECACGASIHGRGAGSNMPSDELTMRHHRTAARDALRRWNTRATPKHQEKP